VCSVYTNGQVVAYSGTVQTQLVHAALTEGQWVRFTMHSDYGTKKWDLYLDGNPTPIGSGLDFFDTGAASYTEFGISGAPSNAVVDEIKIGLSDPRPAGADSDGDGMDDDWERQHFGGTNSVNGGAYEDWDEDGFLNLYEYHAGTNPTNALSLLAVVSLTAGSGDVISWLSVTDKQYSVWRSTNLPAGFGFLQGSILATPPLNTHTAAVLEADCRFYRISVDPE